MWNCEGPLVGEALPSSEFYPIDLNWSKRTLSFVRISQQTYNNAAFLVPQQTDMGRRAYTFNVDDLLLHARRNPWPTFPSHYILISAFCCSTLLARYIDELHVALVLREPGLIAQLGFLKQKPIERRSSLEGDDWQDLVNLSLSLMARAFPDQNSVIIKPSDIGNLIAADILKHDARSRVLLLSVPLRTFILSVLKSPSRRDWVKKRASYWQKSVATRLGLAEIEVRKLNDAQKSAYIWLITNCLWLSVRQSADRDRIEIMDGNFVSAHPLSALRRLAHFFNLDVDEDVLTRAVESDAASKHSKRQKTDYSAEARARDLVEWERSYGQDTSHALRWANKVANRLNLSIGDGPVVELR